MFWSERDVFWGRGVPAGQGQLWGREKLLDRRGAPTKTEFKNAKEKEYNRFVDLYCLYGDGELFYVGEAGLGNKGAIFRRLKRHRTDSLAGRWDSFSWFGRADCEGKQCVQKCLAQLEAIVIAITNLGHNRQSGKFAGAKQVFQVPHPDAEGNIDTKLAQLAEQIRSLGRQQ